jgi:hypothetical protein
MNVLCIGGHNDGKVVDVLERKVDGDIENLAYYEKLRGDGINGGGMYPLGIAGADRPITMRTEQYTVRDIHFRNHKLVRVLVIHPSADYVWILKALIRGYRQPKGDNT